MKWIDHTKIRTKLILLALIPSLAMLALGMVSVNLLRLVNQGVDRIYLDRVVPLQELKAISDDYAVRVIDAVNKANGGLLTAEESLRMVEQARQGIDRRWKAYIQTELTEEEAALVEQASTLFATADASIDRLTAELGRLRGGVAGQLNAFDGPLYAIIDPVTNKIDELVSLQLRVAHEEKEYAEHLYAESLTLFAAGTTAALLLVALLGWLFYRSVIGQLGRLRLAMAHILEHSDLSFRADLDVGNEIGEIASDFDRMVERLRDLVEQISGSALTLSAATSQMTTSLVDARNGANRQTQETEQAATAMEQMTATAEEVARNTSDAAGAARQARELAEQGNGAVGQTVEAMSSLVENIAQAGESIESLRAEMQGIGKVLEVIQGVTEQTNLLALNAAIEAARAGDQGRGFAVVADEVRTLAQRTQTSANEIESMVEKLQNSSQRVGEVMHRSERGTSQAMDAARKAGEALADIRDAVGGISDFMTQIASATQEQTAVASEINQNVVAIRDATHQGSAGMTQLEAAGAQLNGLADELRNRAGLFRGISSGQNAPATEIDPAWGMQTLHA
ncbi:methyl-accepting chemotaxis protein [Imhoffiella purpurea]|uniref:Methyl-accepting chemotaxis protein n=1 Tax=Imhoffiella purpurea TaxID=1249627 RepID=W9UZV6_9GAMM|nr:methyl-accepting chemotaxis protein [Imhoffiella purpurea]EXJ12614.1 methyl-accepting chemotaxis protein [Imhoffiella purpurea]